ncbi:NADH/Ubiquinone/plastoquinone (Complex I) [Candidatus Vecturithrix granuli]|uniref:NADH/Ubiquinone/plastoquinone (Complex I) n=1 Tax=Vecturithrix granuli TaxID=1499967 RepID=A0A081C506_VECG1|nr:NADH/Ubiquinone/plastoquinone (Complex I) [Candidatus Vecturithrix granuli]
MMNDSLILLIVIPFMGALVCLGCKFFRTSWLAPLACMIALIACCAQLMRVYPALLHARQATYIVGGWSAVVGIRQLFDGLAWIGCALVMTISLVVLLFVMSEQRYGYTFYFFYLLMIAGMTGVLLAADLFNLFVFFEILGITVYILIAYCQERHALVASFKYLMLSSLGITFFLLGIFIIYQQTGSLSFYEIAQYAPQSSRDASRLSFALAALVAGISIRTAYIPFHVWLPDAYASAPHPVSAILSGAVGKVSFLAIWRLVLSFEATAFRALFFWLGAATALVAVIYALSQTDCKKLLAWHSISQVGYILVGFGVKDSVASVGSIYHLINHALFKTLLFLCIGSVITITGERNIKHLGYLGRHVPLLMVLFSVGALSIMGIPPFNGFISKKLIETGVKDSPFISSILWVAGVGTMASFLKLSAIFRRNPYQQTGESYPLKACSALKYASLIFLAFLCCLTGIAASFFSGQIARLLFGHPLQETVHVYSAANMFKTGMSLVFGFGVYLAVLSHTGHRLTAFIRKQHLSFQSSLIWCILGFVLLAVYAGW